MMTFFIFAGDMLVMLFMVVLVTWLALRGGGEQATRISRIPLEDERDHG